MDRSAPNALRRLRLADADDDVLARFYRELMQPAFPPAELMTLVELTAGRRDPSTDGLLLLDGDRPVAGMVTEDFLDGAVRLLAYLVVAADTRGRGLGEGLLRELGPARPGGLVVAEIEDPRVHAVSDAGDPMARLRFYDRFGGRLLPLPYVQPSLRAGAPRVDALLLITLGETREDVDGTLIAAFLDEYYAACEGESVIRGDPAYLALRSAAGDRPGGRLPLHRLTDLTSARPAPT